MSANFKQTSHVPDWILWLLAVGIAFALGILLMTWGTGQNIIC
jgi:hypothetical protein